jgi:mRNA-degrading endonuclease RelE of RelBE toxin-antitoxin system
MSVKVRITPAALAELAALHEPVLTRVNRAMERLAGWPDVSGAKPLRGQLKGHFRIRTGDWRIIFAVTGETVIVIRIANRRDVYED